MIEAHYKKHRRRLVKTQVGRVGSLPNAEDVVQEAYSRALKYFNSWVYRPDKDSSKESSFEKWFRGILNNATRDFQRESRMNGMVKDEGEDEELYTSPDPVLLDRIQGDIKALKGVERKIMNLYFNLGYKPNEIYELTPLTPNNVRQKIFAFRKAMQEKYSS